MDEAFSMKSGARPAAPGSVIASTHFEHCLQSGKVRASNWSTKWSTMSWFLLYQMEHTQIGRRKTLPGCTQCMFSVWHGRSTKSTKTSPIFTVFAYISKSRTFALMSVFCIQFLSQSLLLNLNVGRTIFSVDTIGENLCACGLSAVLQDAMDATST